MNIVELNYSDSYLKPTKFSNITKSIFRILKKLVIELVKDSYFLLRCNPRNKIVTFSTSINQYNSIKTVHKRLESSKSFGLNGKSENRIPMGIGCLFSLLLTPKFIYDIFTKYKNDKKKIISRLENYYFIEGVAIWWTIYFTFFKPKCILLANDHNLWHRVIRHAGNKRNIPTVYIQHASVSKRFPPLRFTLSLLEGNHAKNIYTSIERNNSIKLVGMAKFDPYFHNANKSFTVEKIGICTNTLDEDDQIFNLVRLIKTEFPYFVVILRPHPLDKRDDLYNKIKKDLKINISSSHLENSFEFLETVDTMIAGESSIHLEAALMNVYPIHFQMSSNSTFHDYYEYIKNGVTDEVINMTDLISKLSSLKKNKPDIRNNAKFYVDTVNTKNDGNSTDLIISNIKDLLKLHCA
jgi:uncharacterized pyridoxamine 5'-phosphate oxidase family protein